MSGSSRGRRILILLGTVTILIAATGLVWVPLLVHQLSTAEEDLKQLRADLSEAQENSADLNKRQQAAEKKLVDAANQITQLNDELTSKDAGLQTLRGQVAWLQDFSELERQLSTSEGEMQADVTTVAKPVDKAARSPGENPVANQVAKPVVEDDTAAIKPLESIARDTQRFIRLDDKGWKTIPPTEIR